MTSRHVNKEIPWTHSFFEAREAQAREAQTEYTIEVDVIVTRTYVVKANSQEDAMTKYRAGDADILDESSEMSDWEEQEHTARVKENTNGDT